MRELLLNIIREIEGGGRDPNTVDALHFRLDWLQGLIARLLDLYGIDEQIVNLIRGARDCLIGSQDTFNVSSPATAFTGQRILGDPGARLSGARKIKRRFRSARKFTLVVWTFAPTETAVLSSSRPIILPLGLRGWGQRGRPKYSIPRNQLLMKH